MLAYKHCLDGNEYKCRTIRSKLDKHYIVSDKLNVHNRQYDSSNADIRQLSHETLEMYIEFIETVNAILQITFYIKIMTVNVRPPCIG